MVDVYSLRFQNCSCSGNATQDLECGTNVSVHVDYTPCFNLNKLKILSFDTEVNFETDITKIRMLTFRFFGKKTFSLSDSAYYNQTTRSLLSDRNLNSQQSRLAP